MSESQLDTPAFRQALLQSERRRIFGVITFVVVFTSAIAIRVFVFGSAMSRWGIPISLLLVLYEFGILRAVDQCLRTARDLPAALWILNIILEVSFPAFGIAILASPRLEVAYRSLATPWVLAFFPFIILSTLRLNPWICRVAGIVAATGFLAAAHHHGWRPSLHDLTSHTVTQTAVPFYAAILLISGFVAGGVASEIRKHVQAALREAETQNKLKQVEHDLQIARSIQQSLLPRVRPTIDGFEIAGWNRPADATGGDYYDWKQMADDSVVVSLADVTGHGIGPALLASVCRAYARASFNGQVGLATTLENINQFLGADLTPGRFATYVAAICKSGNDQVELLSAGHAPLFHYAAATGAFEKFEAQAVPLGILPELNSEASIKLNLRAGDLLLLLTDGFFEWENSSAEQYGVQRLADTVRRCSHLAPEEIIAELYNGVLTFSGGSKQQDDLTAVVIKRVPNAAAAE